MQMAGTNAIMIMRAFLLALGLVAVAADAAAAPRVLLVDVSGAIGIATTRQVSRAIEQAGRESVDAIVLRLDTPGGLVSATREIVRDMTTSPVPIIAYVAPTGARAASAGTF